MKLKPLLGKEPGFRMMLSVAVTLKASYLSAIRIRSGIGYSLRMYVKA